MVRDFAINIFKEMQVKPNSFTSVHMGYKGYNSICTNLELRHTFMEIYSKGFQTVENLHS